MKEQDMRLLITCKQAHALVSEGMDKQLSLGERSRLKVHLSMCKACTNFNHQMRFLRAAMHRFSADVQTQPQEKS
ncbi:zf-HC2 domain-containing protein [Undibacterium sp. SXout7W]|uniref:zf-HC2 domain-containing protein n=1 Tax=Undibacterium sp. SXout7W TaxID=3413049 RepID=UPI003BF30A21